MSFLTQIASVLAPRAAQRYPGPFADSLELLVLQPTPFCNIDCDYCYLPNRDDSRRMSVETIKAAVTMVMEGKLVDRRLSIVWHGGEPLVLPVSYYEEGFAAIHDVVKDRCTISHSFQTNGTLIDESWCAFLKSHGVRVGLSIDGPAFIHDAHRKGRNGKATHDRIMLGAQQLRDHGIEFHVIAVLTSDSLGHAASIFTFFKELGVREIGFNVEELEGGHSSSSLTAEGQGSRIEQFWQTLYDLYVSSDGRMRIREFQRAESAIVLARTDKPWRELALRNDQVLPFRIITVDCTGCVSTFSPELIGTLDGRFHDFIFGQVGHVDLGAIRSSEFFQTVANEVWKGVQECARICEYFPVCGGGAPANKYFENKSLSSTTTMFCRSSIQAPINIVLRALERELNLEKSLRRDSA
jgi:uncharacterized protein